MNKPMYQDEVYESPKVKVYDVTARHIITASLSGSTEPLSSSTDNQGSNEDYSEEEGTW